MKISIITATYKCATTVGDCLDSVAGQSYLNREHLVIDGASPDGTLAVLMARRAQLAALVSEPDNGIYYALNKGLALASGEVVGFLHADDVYGDNEVLARIAAAFTDPTVVAVYGNLEYVSRNDPKRVVRHWCAGDFSPARLRWGWMPPHPTFYLRRSVYERLGGFDTRYRIAADYDLMLRVLSQLPGMKGAEGSNRLVGGGGLGLQAWRVVYLPQVLVRMRLGGESNRSLPQIVRKSREDFQALRSIGQCGPAGLGALGALAWKNLSKVPQFFYTGRLSPSGIKSGSFIPPLPAQKPIKSAKIR